MSRTQVGSNWEHRHCRSAAMVETVAPNKSLYPNSLGGCPPGSHFWSGIAAGSSFENIVPTCIVDPPAPNCVSVERPFEKLHLDPSKPKEWECRKCGDDEYWSVEIISDNFFSKSTKTEWRCVSPPPPLTVGTFVTNNDSGLLIFGSSVIIVACCVYATRVWPWLLPKLLTSAVVAAASALVVNQLFRSGYGATELYLIGLGIFVAIGSILIGAKNDKSS